jgi:hypothetical protein
MKYFLLCNLASMTCVNCIRNKKKAWDGRCSVLKASVFIELVFVTFSAPWPSSWPWLSIPNWPRATIDLRHRLSSPRLVTKFMPLAAVTSLRLEALWIPHTTLNSVLRSGHSTVRRAERSSYFWTGAVSSRLC